MRQVALTNQQNAEVLARFVADSSRREGIP